MKKILIIVLISFISTFGQVKKFTLSQSITLGLQNSKELKISKSKIVESKAQVSAATSHLLPQLSFSGSYMRLSNIPPFQVSLPIFPQPIQISPVILDNYTLKLSLQQPLFTGFKLWSLRSAAESIYNASKSSYNSDLNDAAFKIQAAFWNFYKAGQNNKVIADMLKQIKQHLDDTKNFYANGLVTKNDLLKLEVQYSNVELQKIESDNGLDIARAAFNQALGLPLNDSTEVEAKNIKAEKSNYNYDELVTEAKQNRNELKAMQYRVAASSKNVSAAKSGWFPSLFLIGDYYYSKPNQRIIPAVDKFKDTWDVGVTLSWSIWNWGLTSSQTTIAEQNKIQAETSLAKLKDAVEIEVYQNYLTFSRAFDKVKVAKLSVQQAQENYRITQEKYNTQVASSTDLIDAETSLMQSKTNYNNALVDYEIAKARLDKSIGKKIY